MSFTDTTLAALVAAGAGITGALLTAAASQRVERLRLRAGLTEKAEERRLATLEEFLLAVNSWLDWLVFMEEQGNTLDMLAELNVRVKGRDDAYRRLQLLASESLYQWLAAVYQPLEYELKQRYVRDVRWSQPVDEPAKDVRRAFAKLLRQELVQ